MTSHHHASNVTSPTSGAATPKLVTPTGSVGANAVRAAPTADQERDLSYLSENRICERLEFMVRQLLTQRPDDPVLAMCNALRDANRQQYQQAQAQPARGRSSAANGAAAAPADRGLPPTRPSGSVAPHSGYGATHSAGSHRSEPAVGSPNRTGGGGFPIALNDSSRGSARELIRGGSALHKGGIEREESARSDVSAFSISSVDMSEFLSDFRGAHFSLFGATKPNITINDLADVVDRVALPLPDTRMLSDLHHEMDADHNGAVNFEAFLARMNFRIQGKYHSDVVRGLFLSLAAASGVEPPTLTTYDTTGVSMDDLTNVDDAAPHHANDGVRASSAKPPASATASVKSTAWTISTQVCLDGGLRKGIGLRLSRREFDELLLRIGVPHNDDTVTMHLLDFSRLLHAATSQFSQTQGPPAAASETDLHVLDGGQ
jgi:hypothetical protein